MKWSVVKYGSPVCKVLRRSHVTRANVLYLSTYNLGPRSGGYVGSTLQYKRD